MGKDEVEAAITALEAYGRTIDTWVLICAVGVVLALGAEVVFSVAHWRNDKQLQPLRQEQSRIHESELAQLGTASAEANARAKEAELALIKFRAPRLPSDQQLESLIESIKPFAGTKFDVGHGTEDREQWDFLWRLEPAISKAGWEHIDWNGGLTFRKNNWPGNHVYGVMGVINVTIELHPDQRQTLTPAAQALAAALKSMDIEATVAGFNNSSTNANTVHLLVGPKR